MNRRGSYILFRVQSLRRQPNSSADEYLAMSLGVAFVVVLRHLDRVVKLAGTGVRYAFGVMFSTLSTLS